MRIQRRMGSHHLHQNLHKVTMWTHSLLPPLSLDDFGFQFMAMAHLSLGITTMGNSFYSAKANL
eukprot:3232607-Karenia_brevis.AAC.1